MLSPQLQDLERTWMAKASRQDPSGGGGHWTKKSIWEDEKSRPFPCRGPPTSPDSTLSLATAFRKP